MNTSGARLALAAASLSVIAFAGAQPAVAGQAPPVPPHRHFLSTPGGEVEVGPQVCDDPSLQSAFNQFHAAVHVGPVRDALAHEHNPASVHAGPC